MGRSSRMVMFALLAAFITAGCSMFEQPYRTRYEPVPQPSAASGLPAPDPEAARYHEVLREVEAWKRTMSDVLRRVGEQAQGHDPKIAATLQTVTEKLDKLDPLIAQAGKVIEAPPEPGAPPIVNPQELDRFAQLLPWPFNAIVTGGAMVLAAILNHRARRAAQTAGAAQQALQKVLDGAHDVVQSIERAKRQVPEAWDQIKQQLDQVMGRSGVQLVTYVKGENTDPELDALRRRAV